MNPSRRGFLKGLAASLVAANALPTKAVAEIYRPVFDHWLEAIRPIYTDYLSNVMIYGVGALKTCNDYPYVRSVDPREIMQDEEERMVEARKFSDHSYGSTLVYVPTGRRLK